MAFNHEAIETQRGPRAQRVGEIIKTYTLDTTPWGGSPQSVTVKAYDVTDGGRADVSTTALSGSATVIGDDITLPWVQALTVNHAYQIEVTFANANGTQVATLRLWGTQ